MNRDWVLAHGKALALVAALLERGGVVEAAEFGGAIAVLAATTAETEPEQGELLALWAAIVSESVSRGQVG